MEWTMPRVISFCDYALLPDFRLSLSYSAYAGIPVAQITSGKLRTF